MFVSKADKVQEYALQSVAVTVDIGIFQFCRIGHEVDAFVLHLRNEYLLDFLQAAADIHRGKEQFQFVVINAVEIAHILYEMEEIAADGFGMV